MINDHLTSHGMAEVPRGGFKQSGIGRTHGAIGFDEMTQSQVLVHDIPAFTRRNLWWHPNGRETFQGFTGAIRFLYGKSFSHRVKGLWHLLKNQRPDLQASTCHS